MDLACVAFTGVNSGSMGLVSDPDDEEWGFTGGTDGKDSILAASAYSSSSSDELCSPYSSSYSCSPPLSSSSCSPSSCSSSSSSKKVSSSSSVEDETAGGSSR